MGFGCGHLPINDEIHEASWGARLIYSEVVAGQSGKGFAVVWDRQTPNGEPETVRTLFPVLERAVDEFRKPENRYALDEGQSGHLVWREGRILVVMSPQGSYGYLYITAVLEKEGHEGESEIWGTNGEWAEGDLAKRVQLGNWPPEVVAAREAKEREEKRKSIMYRVANAGQDARWHHYSVIRAKTDRSKAMAIKKQQKLDDEVAAARAAAFAAGFSEEEIDRAQRGY
jgi:hypothetical protein